MQTPTHFYWRSLSAKQSAQTAENLAANLGLLGHFADMLIDSRSFVSDPCLEYFCRILCDGIGGWVENGEYPADMDILGELVQGICFNNAKADFGIGFRFHGFS